MLWLVIASSILALSLLAAAVAEIIFRLIIEVVGKRAASRPMPNQYESDNRLGLLGEPSQFQAR